MKLNEFMQKPLSEALQEMNLLDTKVHTDDNGNVQAVELKYRPNDLAVNTKQEPQKRGQW